jgi:hypothetical protein
MRFQIPSVVALFFVLSFRPAQAADWSIDIVPTSSDGGKQRINIYDPFYVVLTNVTDHDLSVWKERCSWGYFNLSFEFTGENGKVFRVKKKDVGFTVNFPDPYVVKGGRHFVRAVTLRSQDWLGTEKLEGPMTLRAIYENTNASYPGEKAKPSGDPRMDALISSCWVGKVESNPVPMVVTR